MNIGDAFTTAESSMMRGSDKIARIAHEVANSDEDINLEQEMVDMISNQRSFEANAAVISTADDMLDQIFNM